jgi:hypothetical protein
MNTLASGIWNRFHAYSRIWGEPAREDADDPASEDAEEPMSEVAEESVREDAEEPVSEVAEESVREEAEEPAREEAAEPTITSFACDAVQQLQGTACELSKKTGIKAFCSSLEAALDNVQQHLKDLSEEPGSVVEKERLLKLLNNLERLCQVSFLVLQKWWQHSLT